MPGGMHEGKQFKDFRFTVVPTHFSEANEVAVHHAPTGGRETPAGFLSLEEQEGSEKAKVGTVYVDPEHRGRGLAPMMWHAAGGTRGVVEHDVENLTKMGAAFANKVSPEGNPHTGEPFEATTGSLMTGPGATHGQHEFIRYLSQDRAARTWHPGSPVMRGMKQMEIPEEHVDWDNLVSRRGWKDD